MYPSRNTSSFGPTSTHCSCTHGSHVQYLTHVYPQTSSDYFLPPAHPRTYELQTGSVSRPYHEDGSMCANSKWCKYGVPKSNEFAFETHGILKSVSSTSPVIGSSTVSKRTTNRAVQMSSLDLEDNFPGHFDYSPRTKTAGSDGENYVGSSPHDSWYNSFTGDQCDSSLRTDCSPLYHSDMVIGSTSNPKVIQEQLDDPSQSRNEHWYQHPSSQPASSSISVKYFGSAPSTVPVGRRVSWPSSRLIQHTSSSSKATSRRNSEHSNSSATIIASRSSPITITTNLKCMISPTAVLTSEQSNVTVQNGPHGMIAWGHSFVQKILRFCRKWLQRSPVLLHNFTVCFHLTGLLFFTTFFSFDI